MAQTTDTRDDCYVIAEAGLNHNGCLNLAKKMIDVASEAGADAVKFQKRTVSKLAAKSTLDATDDRFPEFGKTYKEIREHLEFNFDEYASLKEYSENAGLDFIVTAFDIDAVDFLDSLGVKTLKLASHSLTNYDLLSYISESKRNVILSTGMANLDELDMAVEIFKKSPCDLTLLHCVSAYPTPLEQSNLAMIDTLKKRYDCRIGYSGHELGYLPTVVAVCMGAKVVERHYTLDKGMVGFDHKISLEPNELSKMIAEIRMVALIKGNGRKAVSEVEQITRDKYHVSMVAACRLSAGECLTKNHITYKNPGTGIPRKDEEKYMGRKLIVDVDENELLSKEMFAE